MNSLLSPYFKYANQTLNWLPMDTEELYLRNLDSNRHLLEKYNWIDSAIAYTFNSYGFRCNEFTNNESVVFLGCSHTLGIGIPVENTWAYHVAKTVNLECYNLAIGGGANDTAFRIAYNWLPRIKPKLVVLCETHPERLEVLAHNESECIMPACVPNWSENFYRRWVDTDSNSKLNQLKNSLAIEQLCNNANIKFVKDSIYNLVNVDLARDLCHDGINTNLNYANVILSKI